MIPNRLEIHRVAVAVDHGVGDGDFRTAVFDHGPESVVVGNVILQLLESS